MRTNNLLTSTALTTSAVLASGTAFAQPVTFNWTGFYVGLNAGGSWTRTEQDLFVPAILANPSHFFEASGRHGSFTGGVQGGYNWLFATNWLAGIEADFNYLRATRDGNFRFNNSGEDVVGSQSTKLRWLSTVRGRLGYVWANTLVYATGGLAIGSVKASASATRSDSGVVEATFAGSNSTTRTGWTIGGGIEQALTDRVLVRVEYIHFDLGSFSYNVVRVSGTDSADVPSTWFARGDVTGNIVRAAVNVRFGP